MQRNVNYIFLLKVYFDHYRFIKLRFHLPYSLSIKLAKIFYWSIFIPWSMCQILRAIKKFYLKKLCNHLRCCNAMIINWQTIKLVYIVSNKVVRSQKLISMMQNYYYNKIWSSKRKIFLKKMIILWKYWGEQLKKYKLLMEKRIHNK